MFQFAGIISFALFAFTGWAIIDVLLTDKDRIRWGWKPVWLGLVAISGPAGAFGWLFSGRPKAGGIIPGGKGQFDAAKSSTQPQDQAELSDEQSAAVPTTAAKRIIPPAPLGPEDSPEWAHWVATNAPAPSGGAVTTDPQLGADFADWEPELGQPDLDAEDE